MAKSVVTGIKDVDRKLAALPYKTQSSLLRKALRKTAKNIQQDAKRNAPKDSGVLRRSIKVRAGKRSRTRISVNVLTDPKNFPGTVYAFFVEKGTKHTAPTPFLRPAMKRAERTAKLDFENTMRELIASVASG